MKKITCLAVLAACVLCITGCGKDENPTAEQVKGDAASLTEKVKADVSNAADKTGKVVGETVDGLKKTFQ